MGASELVAFLSWLAVDKQVSASTQNQASSAVSSVYKAVLGLDIGPLEHVTRAWHASQAAGRAQSRRSGPASEGASKAFISRRQAMLVERTLTH
jgi:hypothetical protein